MKKKFIILIILLILLIFIMASTFTMALSYYLISNFSSSEIYTITQFNRDIELSLVIMISNAIGQIFVFIYLWKKKIISRLFQNNTTKMRK